MVGIVIITHGLFGEELFLAAEMILGKQDNVYNMSILPGKSLSETVDQLDGVIKKNEGRGVLILTDMFGGSPSNVAFSYAGRENIEIISGVNLPMLLKAFSGRMANEPLLALAKGCADAGRLSIKLASELTAVKK